MASPAQHLSPEELYLMASETGREYREIADALLNENTENSLEDVGQSLNRIIWTSDYFTSEPESDFLRLFKREAYSLFCTNNIEYRRLRNRVAKAGDKSETVIVSFIAGALASSSFGLPAVALVPFCAVGLIAVLKMGTEAFCKLVAEDYGPPAQNLTPPRHSTRRRGSSKKS
jgi:hypothetical protein